MGKAAAKRGMTTTPATDELDTRLAEINARALFVGATVNLGWRLAITVVVPLVAGVKLDDRFGTEPWLTLAGLTLAVFAGTAAVWATVKEANAKVADLTAAPNNKLKEKK